MHRNILLSPVLRPLTDLKLDPRNPRVHGERQIRQIAASIRRFGFNGPILIDAQGVVVCGHGRLAAAKLLGMTEVPTVELSHLTPAQARAFAIADNRLAETATWDDALLAQVFIELNAQDLDFSLEDTGFTMGEIDLRIEQAVAAKSTDVPTADAADEIPEEAGPAVCQPGDLWNLGEHRLLCDDVQDTGALDRLMDGEVAQVVFVDPPYNVKIDGHVTGNGKVRHREFAMASGEMTAPQFTQFLNGVFELLARHSMDGSLHFVCMDWRHLAEALAAGHAAYGELKNICVWVKDKGGMGSLYRSQHEMVLVFKHGKAPHRNNIELGRFGRNRTNVWSYPGVNTSARQSEEGNLLALHPTVKPIAMVADALLDCSARRDLVLDCFLGSGTTLLAAERVGRRCCGLELDPLYVDTAIRRWQRLTGQRATHATTGVRFGDNVKLRKTIDPATLRAYLGHLERST